MGVQPWYLTLTPVELMADGNHLFPGQPIFYCGEIRDASLVLSAEIPDTIPNLMVSFRNGSGEETRGLLTQSGEDGHYFLMDSADLIS